jgi:hypothetical protein
MTNFGTIVISELQDGNMIQKATSRVLHCLQEVQPLIENGDWRSAYETLAAENRNHSDEQLERALIDILLQAADSTGAVEQAKPGAAPIPPPGSATCGVIPEVSATELTASKLQEAIDNHGYLLVRGLLSAECSATLCETIYNALHARIAAANSESPGSSNGPWFYESPHFPGGHAAFSTQNNSRKFNGNGSIRVADSPRGAFQVLEQFRALNLKSLLAEYFGEPAHIASRKWVFRMVSPRIVGDGVGGGWHQDGQFMGADARALNMWVALSDCGDSTSAPGLALIPKRIHKIMEYGSGGANLGWTVGKELIEELAEEAPVIRPYFAAGDALFFDHLSLHRSGHAQGQEGSRSALESWFYASSGNAGNYVMPLY